MKRFLAAIILCLGVLGGIHVCAQDNPSGMSYQAVLRNASGGLIMDQNVGVRIRIRQGNTSGTIVYSEKHEVKTNGSGLLSFIIGKGEVVQGEFYAIDWAEGPYFLQTETDPNGGNNYVLSSTTQLLSVPYAYFAAKSGDAFSGDYNDLTNVPNDLVAEGDLATVATTGSYADLQDTPDLSKQVSKDELSPVALSGKYADLEGFPTDLADFTNNHGFLTQENIQLTYSKARGLGVEGGNNFISIPLPTKLSELMNDSRFATMDTVKQHLSLLVSRAEENGVYNIQLSDGVQTFGEAQSFRIPTKVSELKNDSSYLTKVDLELVHEGNQLKLINSTNGSVSAIPFPSKLSDFHNDLDFVHRDSLHFRIVNENLLELYENSGSILASILLPENKGGGTKLPNGTSRGDLLYWNKDRWEVLPAGLEGQVLTYSSSGLCWSNPTIFNEKDLYKVGDAFVNHRGETEGVIVSVDPIKRVGILMSLEDLNAEWSNEYNTTDARDFSDGMNNMRIVSQLQGWEQKYPAFAQVEELPGDWYIPSLDEMRNLILNKENINNKLLSAGGKALDSDYYMTSTEKLSVQCYGVSAKIQQLYSSERDIRSDKNPEIDQKIPPTTEEEDTIYHFHYNLNQGDTVAIAKQKAMNLRPIRKLSWSELHSKAVSYTAYKVGDIYYAADTQIPIGIVIDVSSDKKHGKMLSLAERKLKWTTKTNDEYHGMNNVSGRSNCEILISSPGFNQQDYPAVSYCMANMPWYLPSYDELELLMENFDVIQKSLKELKSKGVAVSLLSENGSYFSSTEFLESSSTDRTETSEKNASAKILGFSKNFISTDKEPFLRLEKNIENLVRAIRDF